MNTLHSPSQPALAPAQADPPGAHSDAALAIGSLPPSTLLDAATTARHLGVTVGTLSVWRSTGRYALPFVKCGSKVRYRAGDLLAFIASRTRTHT